MDCEWHSRHHPHAKGEATGGITAQPDRASRGHPPRRAGPRARFASQRLVLARRSWPQTSAMSTNRWYVRPCPAIGRNATLRLARARAMGDQRLQLSSRPFLLWARPPAIGVGRAVVRHRRRHPFFAASLGWRLVSADTAQLYRGRGRRKCGPHAAPSLSLARHWRGVPANQRGSSPSAPGGLSAMRLRHRPVAGALDRRSLAWQTIFFINPALCLARTLDRLCRHLPESIEPDAPPGHRLAGRVSAFAGLAGMALA